MKVYFDYKEVEKVIGNEDDFSHWITLAVERRGKELGELSYIFLTDEGLRAINKKFLDHDYYTDVITFDYSEGDHISGDIFISIDRVRENADNYQQNFPVELSRVMIHGVLHLLDYGDKKEEEIAQMRKEEEKELTLCPKMKLSST